MAQTILETPFAKIIYHPVEKIVHHQFLQRIVGEELRRALSVGLDVLKKYKAEKWLSDDRLNSVLSEEDEKWAQTVWFPAAEKAGWKYWAIVPPQKAAGQMQMKRQASTVKMGGVTVSMCNDDQEAFKWLVAQGHPIRAAS